MINVFLFNDTATTEIYTLSLHDALPISSPDGSSQALSLPLPICEGGSWYRAPDLPSCTRKRSRGPESSFRCRTSRGRGRSEEHTSNSSHANISYAVFCLKKKKTVVVVTP